CLHCFQVKGVTYSLEKFLGENVWNKNNNGNCDYHKSLLCKSHKNTTLYQCIIYLAPGDYHRFHSPAEWTPSYRRHICGELLSVNPSIAKWIPGLFCLNERAVYVGEWEHGFFSYTAVGATNVGSVKVYFDKTLQTNHKKSPIANEKLLDRNINLGKGDMIGEFRMGSTIVLLFEAPKNFQFNIRPGQRVQMGQGIGCTSNAAKESKAKEV
ncbi:PREDICTED: phosphatidylserine decarboxylase proenzyme, mitochondrial-like, partial [Nicrophorus vespilloides]|uniref:phosphatidylserine decarboxylase n=1 Tax=Nicrophorus vespilloides TaxID=110193 RepID=A0ABM1MNF5_NICVS